MSEVPSELKYTKTHEWVRQEDDGTVTVGITDHAQQLLGDLVFVELAELEGTLKVGDDASVVESVKAASDVYAPISGEVIAVNEELSDEPELVNSDPFGRGWLFQLEPSDESELNDLMDADAYQAYIEAEED